MATQKQIITAVAALLETVTPANGYTSDLAAAVFIEHQQVLAESATLQVIVSRGAKSIPEGSEFGHRRREIEVDITVQGLGTSADDVVQQAADDIDAALYADKKLGGLARWTTIEHSAPDYSGEGADEVIAQQLTLGVGYIES